MAKIYVGATIDPDLYNSLKKKFGNGPNTAMVSKALKLLLEGWKLSDEEKEFISLLRKANEKARENVFGVLKKERFVCEYTFSGFDKVKEKFESTNEFGNISTLISLLLWAWSIDMINFRKDENGSWRIL